MTDSDIERMRPELLSWAMRSVGREDAEDVVQEALLSVYRNRDTIEGDALPYSLKVVTRKILDLRRKAQRRVQAIPASQIVAGECGELSPMDNVEGPPDSVLSHYVRPELALAVWSLKRAQRRALVLNWIYDLTYEEIGRIEGVTGSAAHSRLSRGKFALRAQDLNWN